MLRRILGLVVVLLVRPPQVGAQEIQFDTVPSRCCVQIWESAWTPLEVDGRGGFRLPAWTATSRQPVRFQLEKPGYLPRVVEIPAASLQGKRRHRWPQGGQEYLTLVARVVPTTFVTSPSGAEIWLPLSGHQQEYLGLSGRELPLAPARMAAGDERGLFYLKLRKRGYAEEVVAIPNYALMQRSPVRWPESGEIRLRPLSPLWLARDWLEEHASLAGWGALALAGAAALAWARLQALREQLDRLRFWEEAEVGLGGVDTLRGARIGSYRLLEPIGSGATSTVYRAVPADDTGGEPLAVKLLRPELSLAGEARDRFEDEIRVIFELRHRGIVRLLDWGRHNDRDYLVMEYLPGGRLRDQMRRGQMDRAGVTRLLREVMEAARYAHEHGVVHRDLKPENILLDAQGRSRVVDFGLARRFRQPGLWTQGQVLGTVGYMAPEMLRGEEVGPAADQYALGVLTAELLDLLPAYPGDPLRLLAERMRRERAQDRFPDLATALQALEAATGPGRGKSSPG